MRTLQRHGLCPFIAAEEDISGRKQLLDSVACCLGCTSASTEQLLPSSARGSVVSNNKAMPDCQGMCREEYLSHYLSMWVL